MATREAKIAVVAKILCRNEIWEDALEIVVLKMEKWPRYKGEAEVIVDALDAQEPQECAMCNQLVGERDRAQEAADRLAYAIGTVEEIGEHSNCNDPWEQAHIVLLDKLAKLEPQWIDVKDRLPEPGLIVLAIFHSYYATSSHHTVYRTEPLDESGWWFWRDSHDGRQSIGFTHWMPLPAPPAAQEEKP